MRTYLRPRETVRALDMEAHSWNPSIWGRCRKISSSRSSWATGGAQGCCGFHTYLNTPPLSKEKRKKWGKKRLSLTISEHSLPNSSKKRSVVISPFINLIQGPLSPPLIKAFTIVPEGTWFCTSHPVGHNTCRIRKNTTTWLGFTELGSDSPRSWSSCVCSWEVCILTLKKDKHCQGAGLLRVQSHPLLNCLTEVRRGHQLPWSWSHRLLWATGQGTKLRSSEEQ